MANYIGGNMEQLIDGMNTRYFYGLRKLDDGTIYLAIVDQLNPNDQIEINVPGNSAENYNDFDIGQDFFEGRNVNHDLVYENLNYEQFRWDDKNIFYYVDAEGVLTARLGQAVTYDDGSSSDGLGS
jgi:hypothetical protein